MGRALLVAQRQARAAQKAAQKAAEEAAAKLIEDAKAAAEQMKEAVS
jgi:histone H3/H4